MERKRLLIDSVFAGAFILVMALLAFTINGWGVQKFNGVGIGITKLFGSDTNINTDTTHTITVMLHEMSNTLIYAEDDEIWGTVQVSRENIEKVARMFEAAPNSSKVKKLRAIFEKWQDGNFEDIVDDHNVVWRMLGGNVGKAKAADNKAIEKAKDNIMQKASN
jgi:hypothetical protein